jgi:hypothetical protein
MSAQAMTLNDAVVRLKELVGGDEEEAVPVHRRGAVLTRTHTPRATGFQGHHKSSPSVSSSKVAVKDVIPMDDDFRDF